MKPPNKGFATCDSACPHFDDRLIVKVKFAFQDCLAQFELECAARLHARVHFGFEKPEFAAAICLGAIEREIRILHQCIRCRAIGRPNGDANAGAHHNLMSLDVIGGTNDLDQAGRERVGIEPLRGRDLNNRELVATQSGDDIRVANTSSHAVGRSLQEPDLQQDAQACHSRS